MIFNYNFIFVHQMSTKSALKQYFFFQKGVKPLFTSSETLGFIKNFQTRNTGPYRVVFYSIRY